MTPPAIKPGVTVAHGDDEYTIEQTLTAWYHQLGDASMADLNTSRLDGRSLNENDLRTATDAMPFLAQMRLVIVRDPLSRMSGEHARARFLDQIGRIPPTTSLVLVVVDRPGRKEDWEVLRPTHWLRKWVGQNPDKSRLLAFSLPRANDMAGWIVQQARQQKGQITQQAAAELVKYIGTDTRVAVQEITKLLTYVNYRRAVEIDDVVHLVAQEGEVDIFEMVDAMGNRNSKRALTLVQALLEKQDALSVLAMISRHFRLLLLVREVIDEGGGPAQVVSHLGREPFRVGSRYYAEKLWNQARPFPIMRLEGIYRRLLEMDETFKTSQMNGPTAFAVFIAEMFS